MVRGQGYCLKQWEELKTRRIILLKNGFAEIECDVNANINEEVTASLAEIKKILFNTNVEHAWRICLGVGWGNKALQLASDTREKDEDENFTQDNEGQ